jgi:hypothetical protein
MSLKTKIMNIVASHPKLVTFGIGLAITFVVGTVIGMIDHNQAFGSQSSGGGGGGAGRGGGGAGVAGGSA